MCPTRAQLLARYRPLSVVHRYAPAIVPLSLAWLRAHLQQDAAELAINAAADALDTSQAVNASGDASGSGNGDASGSGDGSGNGSGNGLNASRALADGAEAGDKTFSAVDTQVCAGGFVALAEHDYLVPILRLCVSVCIFTDVR